MRAPRIVEETRHLPITLLENPEDLEVARMVTRRAIARDAVDLGKDTLAEAFERERMHAPQHFPIRFLNLPHRVSVHWQCKCTRRLLVSSTVSFMLNHASLDLCKPADDQCEISVKNVNSFM